MRKPVVPRGSAPIHVSTHMPTRMLTIQAPAPPSDALLDLLGGAAAPSAERAAFFFSRRLAISGHADGERRAALCVPHRSWPTPCDAGGPHEIAATKKKLGERTPARAASLPSGGMDDALSHRRARPYFPDRVIMPSPH